MRCDILFVGKKHYRLWSAQPDIGAQQFLEGFRPNLFSEQIEILETALAGDLAEAASLGIRTIHGLASESFLALLFATLQAPHAPAAWLLLYKTEDIDLLINRFRTETFLPSLITPPVAGSWVDLAKMLVPVDDRDIPGSSSKTIAVGKTWERVALEFAGKTSKDEFNSLKHGLRAFPARPMIIYGGHLFNSESHGSQFPIIEKLGRDVSLGFGSRSWDATRLCADIRVLAASSQTLLEIIRHFHGLGQEDEFKIYLPEDSDLVGSEKRTSSLTDLRMETNLQNMHLPPTLGNDEALEFYRARASPLIRERLESVGDDDSD